MISFLNSVFLIGLPLLSVPVIIHLLNRRRRQVVKWGAMRFLLEAAVRRRRIWRLSDLLLMLLRALAVAALVLALARPMLKSTWLESTGPPMTSLRILQCGSESSRVHLHRGRSRGTLTVESARQKHFRQHHHQQRAKQ